MAVLSRNFRLRCEAISSDWRERLGLRVIDPLPANVLAKNLGATLRRPEEIDIKQEAIDYLCQANDWFGMILCNALRIDLEQSKQPVQVGDCRVATVAYT